MDTIGSMSDESGSAAREAAILALQEAGAAWIVGERDCGELTDTAARALAAGIDGPAVQALASLWRDSDWWDVRATMDAAFDEVGVPRLGQDSEETRLLALAHECRRFLDGSLSARDLTGWAHGVVGHDARSMTERLVELDDGVDWAEIDEKEARARAEPIARQYLEWMGRSRLEPWSWLDETARELRTAFETHVSVARVAREAAMYTVTPRNPESAEVDFWIDQGIALRVASWPFEFDDSPEGYARFRRVLAGIAAGGLSEFTEGQHRVLELRFDDGDVERYRRWQPFRKFLRRHPESESGVVRWVAWTA